MRHALIRRLARGAAALAAALGVALAAPAYAQTPSQDAEVLALGAELAHELLAPMNFRKMFADEMGAFDLGDDVPPEWAPLMKEAALEELEQDMPAIERLIGRGLAEGSTVEDMRAIMTFMRSAGGKALLTAMADSAAGRPETPPSREATKQIRKFMASPAGRRFDAKLDNFEAMMDPLTVEFVAEIVPGMLRRFGEKAEALEAARNSGR